MFISTSSSGEAPLNKLKESRRWDIEPYNPLAVTFDPNEVKGHTDKGVNGKQGNFV